MSNLPEPFDVPFTEGPDCPICHSKVVLQCKVRVKRASVRITGGDSFSSDMAADLDAEVISVIADHGCKPRKEERR